MTQGFPAHFSDGRSAARVSAQVVLAPGRLEVLGPDGGLLAGWRYQDLRLQDKPRPGEPLRLSSIVQPDARVTVLNAQASDELHRRLVAISGIGGGPGRVAGWIAAAAVASALAVWGIYEALPLLARPVARAIPLEWEETLGDSMARSALKEEKTCASAAGQAALDDLVARIVAANRLERRFTLHVVSDKTVNAFALPGGHMLLLSGLIEDARTPDELAGVVAHEMSHILERHAAERMVRAAGVGLLLTWLTGDPSSVAASAGGMLLNLSYSRRDESAADARGVALLEAAGIGTGGLSTFFLRLAEHSGMEKNMPELLSSHPRSTDRAAAHAGKAGQPALTEPQWQAVKAMCRS